MAGRLELPSHNVTASLDELSRQSPAAMAIVLLGGLASGLLRMHYLHGLQPRARTRVCEQR
eukprot:397338-Pleurochrysis_carterae.AAC.3